MFELFLFFSSVSLQFEGKLVYAPISLCVCVCACHFTPYLPFILPPPLVWFFFSAFRLDLLRLHLFDNTRFFLLLLLPFLYVGTLYFDLISDGREQIAPRKGCAIGRLCAVGLHTKKKDDFGSACDGPISPFNARLLSHLVYVSVCVCVCMCAPSLSSKGNRCAFSFSFFPYTVLVFLFSFLWRAWRLLPFGSCMYCVKSVVLKHIYISIYIQNEKLKKKKRKRRRRVFKKL